MEIVHFSHEHALVLDRMEDMAETCNACTRTVNDLGYVCSECGFVLHKKCAKFPRETKHHLHPQHTLKLISKHPDSSEDFKCSHCGEIHRGFVFMCDECQFSMDINCFSRTLPWENVNLKQKTRKLQHFSHLHTLVLRFIQEQGSDRRCKGCDQPLFGPTYCCPECPQFFLHKSCAQMPREISHPFHTTHPLILLAKSPYGPGNLYCDGCRKRGGDNNFVYHCSNCHFDLDLTCASQRPLLKHEKHKHGLSLFEEVNTQRQFPCAVCSKNCSDHFYRCIECNFNCHANCFTLQSNIKHKGHPHCLSLTDSVVKDGLAGFPCEVCKRKITPKHRIYYCAECSYGVHPECVESEGNQDTDPALVKLLGDIKVDIGAALTKLGTFLETRPSI